MREKDGAALPGYRDAEYAEKCRVACAGLPPGAIDGGWTAAGMSAYARKLELALAPFAKHPAFHAPDDWPVTVIDRNEPTGEPVAGVTAGDFRRAREALGLNAESSGAETASAGLPMCAMGKDDA